jgi:hypothetical protein
MYVALLRKHFSFTEVRLELSFPLCRQAGRQGVPKCAGLVTGFHHDDFKQKALP